MASVKIQRRRKPHQITFSGDMTIDTVEELRASLVPSIKAGEVEVRFDAVGQIDLAALQLLLAFDATATGAGMLLSYEDSETYDRFVRMAEFAGLRSPGKRS